MARTKHASAGGTGHHPECDSCDVRRRIAGSVDHAEGRIDKFIVIENEAPSEVGHEDEQKHHKVLARAVGYSDLSARLRLPDSEHRAKGENRQGPDRQNSNASLQQFIEWKAENIEAQVDAKKRVRNCKRAAIPETEKAVPLAGYAQRKDQRENHNCEIDSKYQQLRADVDVDCLAGVGRMCEGLVKEAFSIHQVDISSPQNGD